MEQVTDTTATTTAVTKVPSKKSQATKIFQDALVEREQGLYATNKAFRQAVLTKIQTELTVSVASSATIFNSLKIEAEAVNPMLGLGRDPKIEKPASTGKRGRKAKVDATVATAEIVTADPAVAAESAVAVA